MTMKTLEKELKKIKGGKQRGYVNRPKNITHGEANRENAGGRVDFGPCVGLT
jgi:hypothetical protein